MRPRQNIEKFIKDASIHSNPDVNQAVLKDLLKQIDNAETQKSALTLPNIRRTIMKSPITKLAAAAVIIALVVLGLFELIDTESTSGVVWADVLTKVQASRGVIYRDWRTDVNDTSTYVSNYEITYLTPTQYRSEGFRDGKLWISMYDNRETRKRVVLLHFQKGYVLEAMKLTEQGNQKHANYQNPTWWAQMFMSCKYSKLKPKEIDSILCEGIETTDLKLTSEGGPRMDRLVAQLWVSVKTGYPVLFEGKFYGENSIKTTIDQFQWDVELDPNIFEPNIPPDYEQM